MLFANQTGAANQFSTRRLTAFAEEIDAIDMAEFESCLDDPTVQEAIDADMATAEEFGLTGTPSVLIDGEQVSADFVSISRAVQEKLSELEN